MSPSLNKMLMPNAFVGFVKADKIASGELGTDMMLPKPVSCGHVVPSHQKTFARAVIPRSVSSRPAAS
jgi:hypothetical protein